MENKVQDIVKDDTHCETCCGEQISTSAPPIPTKTPSNNNLQPFASWILKYEYLPVFLSLGIFLIVLSNTFIFRFNLPFFPEIALLLTAYVLAGYKTLTKAVKGALSGNVFNEFFLMSIATLGAFYIGEYLEGVAVLLFYEIGELIQGIAVKRARRSVKALLEIRPDSVTVLRKGQEIAVHPQTVAIGETIHVKPGEKVALDGNLLSDKAYFNTVALTGESVPVSKYKGESILAGMVNENILAQVRTTSHFANTKLSRILQLVEQAAARKAPTQRFISEFAKIYTPIVVFLALAVVVLPMFVVENYVFDQWFYRALVFLVISCPCALMVSIPLGYFGGIGAASKNGILFKGAQFLDLLTKVKTVVLDKTGTLTKGVFKIQEVVAQTLEASEFLHLLSALESQSSHPIARAITASINYNPNLFQVEKAEEISGHGIKGLVNGDEVLAGNARLLKKFEIDFPVELEKKEGTLVLVAVNRKFAGYIVIADEIREDGLASIQELRKAGVQHMAILSGDHVSSVNQVAAQLKINEAYGDLLPEDKVKRLESIKKQFGTVAFAGDGINDAPALALADVGIAMGGLGIDAAIETADVVIQTDQPSKIATAIRISKATRNIVWQNISLALGVKIAILALGAGGVTSLWEAVFADVGVALLAILNAVRIQRMKF